MQTQETVLSMKEEILASLKKVKQASRKLVQLSDEDIKSILPSC